ncbi:ABC-type nitrate/sulfonate/bicarbonate transport system, permease component [Cognatiyoonia koreensis]|uniref:ABC-type nitrate/sulfonate/bicarbonate transport system, permease component n=1 Tax=Cognatiyoonia koreensis TaxID=364200 RepID=A0A1I0QX02_9RHOB|nr:ABC transporter permease subunit [Cognatiyoonia koreensis]SEW32301.1 ABC-type nitrate/sulfonate/bicarbonate transport system, permease component [Cognatiyoonia koreensis]
MRTTIWSLAALVCWELLAQLHPDSVLITGPRGIATYLFDNAGLMARATLATSQSAAWGFLWGNIVAIILAAIAILVPRSERAVSALSLLVFCLPLVATGPILRVLFGPGIGPQITLAALAVSYTTYLAVLVGLRAIPQSWRDLVAIYGRGAWITLVIVRAQASLPYLFVGLQIAAPAAFLGAMIGEFTGAERGLGVLTLRAMRALEVNATWSLATVAALIAMLAYGVVSWVAKRCIGYAPVILLSPPTGKKRPLLSRLGGFAGLTIAVLLVWQFSMDAFDLNRFFAKRPGDIWTFLTAQPEQRAILLGAMAETLTVTFPGYLAGLFLGAALAAIVVLFPRLSSSVLPVAVALRAIPIITTAPLLVLALGRGAVGTITIVAVMIFFPTLIACLQGLRQTPGQITDVFQSYRAGRFRLLVSAQIPSMLPAFFASARMAVPAALLAVTTTEWLATGKGIGVLMALTASTSNYNMLWSCVVVLSLAAVTGYGLITWIERAVLGIYASEQLT